MLSDLLNKLRNGDNEKFQELMLSLAKKYRDKDDIPSSMAAAVIYTNYAEALAVNMHRLVFTATTLILSRANSPVELAKWKAEYDKYTHLEKTIEHLRYFNFPLKEKYIDLLIKIKDARNNVYHSLFTAHKKGFLPGDEIDSINKNIDILREMHQEIVVKLQSSISSK